MVSLSGYPRPKFEGGMYIISEANNDDYYDTEKVEA
jgi:hypothetical protein